MSFFECFGVVGVAAFSDGAGESDSAADAEEAATGDAVGAAMASEAGEEDIFLSSAEATWESSLASVWGTGSMGTGDFFPFFIAF